jgi:hypothetical protein
MQTTMTKTKRTIWTRAAGLACAALLVIACSGDGTGPGPQPGQLTVNVSENLPDAPTGAAWLVSVTGPELSSAAAAGSGDLIYSAVLGDTLTVVVIGAHLSGALFRFSVPDVKQVSSYSATLKQAARNDNSIASNSYYALTVSR